MKIRLSFLVAIVFYHLSILDVQAQNDENKTSFTLEECIEYALKNSINVKNAGIDAQIAKAQVGEIRATGLPQISGAVQLAHNEPLRRMFLRADNPVISGIDELSHLPSESILALSNFFQLPSSGDAGLTVNQLLFSGSYIVGLRAAKSYQDLTIKSANQTKIQTVEQVTKAYYTVLINNERLLLFEENIARVDSLFRNTKGLHQSGFAEKIDVDRIQVTLNNLKIEKQKFVDLTRLSKELLKFQMNYPMNKDIQIVGSARDLSLDENLEEKINEFDYANRVEYSLLQTEEDLRKLDVQNNNSAYLPTLSAFANLGYFTQSTNIKGLFKTETEGVPVTSQIGPDKWYGYGLFGINLNVPIFDGLGRSYRMQQAKLNLLKVQNSFEMLKSNIDLQVNQSKINFDNSVMSLNAQKENVALAEEVARVTKIKYTEGVGSNLEVTEAESALREAQVNYFNALYDAMMSQIDLKIALGTLTK